MSADDRTDAQKQLERLLGQRQAYLRQDPENPHIMMEIGETLLALTRRDEALEILYRASKRFFELSQLLEAASVCSKILSRLPQDKHALKMLSKIQHSQQIPPAVLRALMNSARHRRVSEDHQVVVVQGDEAPSSIQLARDRKSAAVEAVQTETLERKMPPPRIITPINMNDPTMEIELPDDGDTMRHTGLQDLRRQVLSDSTPDAAGQEKPPGHRIKTLDPKDAAVLSPHEMPTHKLPDLGLPVDDESQDPTVRRSSAPVAADPGERARIPSNARAAEAYADEQERTSLAMPLPEEFLFSGDLRRYREGEMLFEERQRSSELLIIRTGQVEVIKETRAGPRQLSVLCDGAMLGELALLGDGKRHTSVRALGDCEVQVFDDEQSRIMLRSYPEVGRLIRKTYRDRLQEMALKTNPLFEHLPRAVGRQFLRGCRPIRMKSGQAVIEEGRPPGVFYLILLGRLKMEAVRGSAPVALGILEDGDCFGAGAIIEERAARATVTALGFTQLLQMASGDLFRFTDQYPGILDQLQSMTRERAEAHDAILSGKAHMDDGELVYLLD